MANWRSSTEVADLWRSAQKTTTLMALPINPPKVNMHGSTPQAIALNKLQSLKLSSAQRSATKECFVVIRVMLPRLLLPNVHEVSAAVVSSMSPVIKDSCNAFSVIDWYWSSTICMLYPSTDGVLWVIHVQREGAWVASSSSWLLIRTTLVNIRSRSVFQAMITHWTERAALLNVHEVPIPLHVMSGSDLWSKP